MLNQYLKDMFGDSSATIAHRVAKNTACDVTSAAGVTEEWLLVAAMAHVGHRCEHRAFSGDRLRQAVM